MTVRGILPEADPEMLRQFGVKYITRNNPVCIEDYLDGFDVVYRNPTDIYLWNDLPARVESCSGIYYCSEEGNLVGGKMVGMIEVDKVQNKVKQGDCYRITEEGNCELVYGGNNERR